MFVRKKVNKSGSVSIQIVDKSNGYKILKTVGTSDDQLQIKHLVGQAEQIIGPVLVSRRNYSRAMTSCHWEFFKRTFKRTNSYRRTELIFGSLFDKIGFGVIKDELFRHLVVTRLVYPTSKLKTVDYLYRYQGVIVEVDTIYRFLDKLNDRYKAQVEQIAFEYTKRALKDILVVFYDMTTLYFESEDEDDLRKIGFSKDGKFRNPQIMLGLLVGQEGYPIGYDIFEGNVLKARPYCQRWRR